MTELARCELSIAWFRPRNSLRSRSDTIRPAGSSAPRLMRRPVDRRCSRVVRSLLERVRLLCAMSEAMLVLMRAMAILLDCSVRLGTEREGFEDQALSRLGSEP